jgi:hypothetical protein
MIPNDKHKKNDFLTNHDSENAYKLTATLQEKIYQLS